MDSILRIMTVTTVLQIYSSPSKKKKTLNIIIIKKKKNRYNFALNYILLI